MAESAHTLVGDVADLGSDENPSVPVSFVQVQTLGGELTTVSLLATDNVTEVLKSAVEAAGGPPARRQKLLWEHQVLHDGQTAQECGFTTDVVTVVTVIDAGWVEAFTWAFCDGVESIGTLSEDRAMYQRGNKGDYTEAIRSCAPLPRNMQCFVRFEKIGSHTAVGLVTDKCKLYGSGYQFLLGDDAESWALCCHSGASLSSRHSNVELAIPLQEEPLNIGRGPSASLSVALTRTNSRKLMLSIPGYASDLELFTDLPEDKELFVAAVTVYGHAKVFISNTQFDTFETPS